MSIYLNSPFQQEYSLIHDTLKKYVHSRENSTGENIYFNQ